MLAAQATEKLREFAHKDQFAVRHEYLYTPPRWIQRLSKRCLCDERDVPMFYLIINILTITIPSAILLFFVFPRSHVAGVLHVAINYALFLQRFMLTLHFSEHRRLFRKGYDALNLLIPIILAPFFGVPSGMYRLHHCIMHHVGNNHSSKDRSSTEKYQRDNILHFLQYWIKHALFALIYVPFQAILHKRWDLFISCVLTEGLYIVMIGLLYTKVAALPTLYVFVIPFMVSSVALMLGNWSQHIFIDPSNPRSNFKLTYNCVDCSDNQKTYNDGYHIMHHHNSQIHWSELPEKFIEAIEKHCKEDALIFQGIGFFDIGVAVLTHRWLFLAQHLVPCSERMTEMTTDELIKVLKERVKPIL